MGGKGKGKGGPPPPEGEEQKDEGGGGEGPPPPEGGGAKGGKGKGKKTKEEMDAERAVKRAAEKEASERLKAQERAHMQFLEELPTRPAADIGKVDWSKAKCQVILGGGTTLVELESGNIICVRRPREPAAELIAQSVAAAVGGVRVPKFRLVPPDNEEYTQIREMDARTPTYVEDMPMTFEKFIGELKEADCLSTEVKRPIVAKFEFTAPTRATELLECVPKADGTLFIVEFVRGRGLNQICGKLDNEDQLRALGRLCALDALLNQSNQIPLPVWRESGNLTNVMVQDKDSVILAIDLQVTPVKEAEMLAEYNQRLQLMIAHLLDSAGGQESPKGFNIGKQPAFDTLRELLKTDGFEVDDAAQAFFMEGLQKGFHNVSRSWSSGTLDGVLAGAEALAAKSVVPPVDDVITPQDCGAFLRSAAAAIAEKMP